MRGRLGVTSPIDGSTCRQSGSLSFDPPTAGGATAYDSYVSDPANPVPYRARPIRLNAGWTTWLVEDQRFVQRRPDVLDWVSEPLATDLTISGRIVAHLFAASSGTDSDWVVKLIDVYPEKYEPDPEMGGYQFWMSRETSCARDIAAVSRAGAADAQCGGNTTTWRSRPTITSSARGIG